MSTRNQPYTRQLFCTLLFSAGMALLFSVGSWFLQTETQALPVYLLHLPYWIGVPFLLLGGPVALLSAPDPYVRTYTRGAIVLAVIMASTWCAASILDPHATQQRTQISLLCGWAAGGTTYEILLLFLVANASGWSP